jgi:hypothetical protein
MADPICGQHAENGYRQSEYGERCAPTAGVDQPSREQRHHQRAKTAADTTKLKT